MFRNILRWGGIVAVLLLSLTFVQLALFSQQAHASPDPPYCQQHDAKQVAAATDPNAPFISDVLYERCLGRIQFYIHTQTDYPAFQIDYRTPGMLEEVHSVDRSDPYTGGDQGQYVYWGVIPVNQNSTTYTFHVRTCVVDHTMVSSYICSQTWSNTMSIFPIGFSNSPNQ